MCDPPFERTLRAWHSKTGNRRRKPRAVDKTQLPEITLILNAIAELPLLITFLAALLELSRRNFLHIAVDNSLKLIGGELKRAGESARENLLCRN